MPPRKSAGGKKKQSPPEQDAFGKIESTYRETILVNASFDYKTISSLELSQYFETTLWPVYNEEHASNHELIMSIVVMLNEKFHEKVNVWQWIAASDENRQHFALFFFNACKLILVDSLDISEKLALLIFLIRSFNSVENEMVRKEIQKYISMPIWVSLSSGRLQVEFTKMPELAKFWKKVARSDAKLSVERKQEVDFERRFLYNLIFDFFSTLHAIQPGKLSQQDRKAIKYCERFLELLIDLESLLPTRRFFNTLLDDLHVITVCRLSQLNAHQELSGSGRLFRQLLDRLKFYTKFEIDDASGEALTDNQIMLLHLNKFTRLQKVIYKLFGQEVEEQDGGARRDKLRQLFLTSISQMDTRESFLKHFSVFSEEDLIQLIQHLDLGLQNDEQVDKVCSFIKNHDKKQIILEILVDHYERVESQLRTINSLPLYPPESVIWDENLVPADHPGRGDSACLSLPKLNIQFLTLHDYLLRNFQLFRLESTYEIRADIENAVAHLKPWQTEDGGFMFGGWSRMAIPVESFTIHQIGKANIGERKPSKVKAEIVVNLNVKRSVKQEWEQLRKHDVVFLVTVRPEVPPGTKYKYGEPFVPQVGLTYVRGCEVEGMLDPTGRLVDDTRDWQQSGERPPPFTTDFRTYRVWLDTNQYQEDTDQGILEDVYDSFNILVRRKPKENNFKVGSPGENRWFTL